MLTIKTILIFTITSGFFSFAFRVRADLFGDYVYRDTQEVEQRRTVGSGSRSGCQSNIDENSVSLLVPEREVVHQTSLERPTLFIITDRAFRSMPFKFTLVNPQTTETLVEKDFLVSSNGIKEIELPEATQLKYNEIYLWYVAIPCVNKPTEYREVLGAAIKRTQPDKQLKTQLQQAKTELQTAAIYAENGFWYDALELAVEEENDAGFKGKDRANPMNYLKQLLSSAGLSL